MKRGKDNMFKKLMCAMLVLAMAGCAKKPIEEIVDPDPVGALGSNTDAGDLDGGMDDEDYQIVEAEMGEKVETYFFDWTVNSAEQVDEYGSLKASDGNSLLVVNVTIKNTFKKEIEMYDSDFEVIWTFDDDSFAVPVTLDNPDLAVDGMLEGAYTLKSRDEVTGDLVFEVPYGNKDFLIGYVDMFDDGTGESTEGDMYVVYLTAY